jgi:MFS family permease
MTQSDPAPADEGWRFLLRDGNGPRALMLSGGVALHAVSIYVVATIMPLVVGEVGGIAFFAWTATLYVAGSLCSAAAVPGLLARLGPRGTYRIAFCLFALGSLVCSVAPSMTVLLLGRLVQGLGGGMLPALSYGIIRIIFPPALHARAIVLIGSVWGIAALAGPTIGGVFGDFGVWRAAFWVDVALAALFILASGRVLPATMPAAGAPRRFPGLRLILLAGAALCVGAGGATAQPGPAALGMAAAVALILLVKALDRRAAAPLLPSQAFNPRYGLGAVSATMALLILSGSANTFLPFLLHNGHGWSTLAGGYMAAVYALSWTAFSFVSGTAGPRGVRASIAAGPPLMVLGLAVEAVAVPLGWWPAIAAGQVLLGAGIGLGWAHLGALMMQVAPAAERELAGPFITATQTLATVFGSALAGMVANLAGLTRATTPEEMAAVATWLFAATMLAPLLACFTAWRTLVLTRKA